MLNLKQTIRRGLPSAVVEALDREKDKLEFRRFLRRHELFTRGHELYVSHYLTRVLSDTEMLRAFKIGCRLPKSYGAFIGERCVEYPWMFSHLSDRPGLLLDAGSTLNHKYVLDSLIRRTAELHIMTLEPEWECYWNQRISYLFGDLRDIPIRDGYYDTITCISVAEHVGMDNRAYYTERDEYRENKPNEFEIMLRELRRVLRPGGVMFLTVPFGTYENLGWQQQFDIRLLERAIAAFGDHQKVESVFFRYNDGWQIATAEECVDDRYATEERRATAVACLRIVT